MNASDEGSVKKAVKAEKIARLNELNDMLWVMSMPQGRRFIYKLLEGSNINKSVYSENPYDMYFREGNRNLGLKILADIMEVKPEAYLQMVKEAKDDSLESNKTEEVKE